MPSNSSVNRQGMTGGYVMSSSEQNTYSASRTQRPTGIHAIPASVNATQSYQPSALARSTNYDRSVMNNSYRTNNASRNADASFRPTTSSVTQSSFTGGSSSSGGDGGRTSSANSGGSTTRSGSRGN
jgi:hypothetical protein